jgi:hypothetical protein
MKNKCAFVAAIIITHLLAGCLLTDIRRSRETSDLIVKFVRHDLAAGSGIECIITCNRITLSKTNDFGFPRKMLYDVELTSEVGAKMRRLIRESGLCDIGGELVIVSKETGRLLADVAHIDGTIDRITIGRCVLGNDQESVFEFYMFGNHSVVRVVEAINAVLPTEMRIIALPLDWEPQTTTSAGPSQTGHERTHDSAACAPRSCNRAPVGDKDSIRSANR